MSNKELEMRVIALEAEVAELKARLKGKRVADPWLEVVWGSFADDPAAHEEAMRLGREWRESFRPKPRKSKARRGTSGKTN
jgi:hypothetical protein